MQALEAFFVERVGGKAVDFLRALAEQRDDAALAAGIALVRGASTAKPRAKSIAATKSGKPKRVELVHHGDLEILGDADATTLIVTGSLRVQGTLTNYEGRVVSVGGDLEADAMWSEGPLWIAGDARVRAVFAGAYNDYAARIVGALTTPVLVQLDHVIETGTRNVETHITERKDIPPPIATALRIVKL